MGEFIVVHEKTDLWISLAKKGDPFVMVPIEKWEQQHIKEKAINPYRFLWKGIFDCGARYMGTTLINNTDFPFTFEGLVGDERNALLNYLEEFWGQRERIVCAQLQAIQAEKARIKEAEDAKIIADYKEKRVRREAREQAEEAKAMERLRAGEDYNVIFPPPESRLEYNEWCGWFNPYETWSNSKQLRLSHVYSRF